MMQTQCSLNDFFLKLYLALFYCFFLVQHTSVGVWVFSVFMDQLYARQVFVPGIGWRDAGVTLTMGVALATRHAGICRSKMAYRNQSENLVTCPDLSPCSAHSSSVNPERVAGLWQREFMLPSSSSPRAAKRHEVPSKADFLSNH